MYVCLCNGITDGQIREAARERGCDNLRDLRRELGVGSQCAKCARHARQVLREARGAAPPDSISAAGGVVRYWPRTA